MTDYASPDYKTELSQLEQISNDFLNCLRFCVQDTGRDKNFWENHLFAYIAQDLIQSSFSILLLAYQGIRNPCKRELRFLLELAIKQCFIEQKFENEKAQSKVEKYKDLLKSPNISIKTDLELNFLSENTRANFLEDVGRFYGSTSKYVHLSPEQVLERISLIEQNITAGMEGLNELKEMVQILRHGYALILVLIFHSVPSYVTGDFLVNFDGSSNDWCFRKSKYIAEIESNFDYKHERQSNLSEIIKKREREIEF